MGAFVRREIVVKAEPGRVFEAEDGGTRVTVHHDGIGQGPSWDGYAAGLGPGWERSLADLRGWLEEGRKLPGR